MRRTITALLCLYPNSLRLLDFSARCRFTDTVYRILNLMNVNIDLTVRFNIGV